MGDVREITTFRELGQVLKERERLKSSPTANAQAHYSHIGIVGRDGARGEEPRGDGCRGPWMPGSIGTAAVGTLAERGPLLMTDWTTEPELRSMRLLMEVSPEDSGKVSDCRSGSRAETDLAPAMGGHGSGGSMIHRVRHLVVRFGFDGAGRVLVRMSRKDVGIA